MTGERAWGPDLLGPDFSSLRLSSDGGGPEATLVRYQPVAEREGGAAAPSRTVLYIPGWSDYFFNTELASFWHRQGFAFYALDLHNHGRNIVDGTLGGYVANLRDFDGDIERALGVVQSDSPAAPSVMLMAHSTGALAATLWVTRNPSRVAALILNSPWLESHGSPLLRKAAAPLVAPFARRWPTLRLRAFRRNLYWRSISAEADGEWDVDRRYRPPYAFPVRLGWLSAVLAGQNEVAGGLQLPVPTLVLMSTKSLNGPVWTVGMMQADVVLDVRTMEARARTLGPQVTICKIEGALHDVLLSRAEVRARAYQVIEQWLPTTLSTWPDRA